MIHNMPYKYFPTVQTEELPNTIQKYIEKKDFCHSHNRKFKIYQALNCKHSKRNNKDQLQRD